mmetsp:Transcript_35770/g.81573  ORF Transcript_35770/g.81573 Transcript_35770/m.81573 type:complete len:90 (+) Transcript_35770:101-370(+)
MKCPYCKSTIQGPFSSEGQSTGTGVVLHNFCPIKTCECFLSSVFVPHDAPPTRQTAAAQRAVAPVAAAAAVAAATAAPAAAPGGARTNV